MWGRIKIISLSKSSNQNTVVLQAKHPVKHQADIISCSTSVVPGISTNKNQVDEIIRNLENNLSDQPLRRSIRLNPLPVQNPEPELRCSKCLKQQAANLLGIKDYGTKVTLAMTSIVNQIIDPPTVEAAKKLEDWPQWQVSIKNELDIHKKLRTGELVTPPPNTNIVGSHIVLYYKLRKDGSVSSQKSRLVAQGFTQQERIDFNNTFSPAAKLTATQIITAMAVRNDWELERTDVDVAHLNASLKENIYMRQPKGFETPSQEDKGIYLKQAIYGLRQSGHEWYKDLMSTFRNVGFQRCKVEHAMLYQSGGNDPCSRCG